MYGESKFFIIFVFDFEKNSKYVLMVMNSIVFQIIFINLIYTDNEVEVNFLNK